MKESKNTESSQKSKDKVPASASAQKNEEQEDKEKKEEKYPWLIFVLVCILGIAFWIYNENKYPALIAFGKNPFSLICEGEGRTYQLRSQNGFVSRGTWTEKSLTTRELHFLDKEGKILYSTGFFDSSSLDKDGVWRFRYNKPGGLRDRLDHLVFKKTEKYPLLHKLMTKMFQADWRKYKDKSIEKALYGDEEVFEISKHFNSLTILRKNDRLTVPCQRTS